MCPASSEELTATLTSIEKVLDLDALRTELAGLEEQAAQPDLWSDQERATQVTSRLSQVQAELRRVEDLRRRLEDAAVLHELAEAEDDAGTRDEVETELAGLRKAIGELEVRTLLGGEYDARDALVTVQAEAGGVDAADWAQMLLRMYLRWAERHGYPTEVYDTSYAEEAGIKSATFAVKAQYAYGTLAGEHGTHRLVRISPFDNQHRRQTSFAGVDVVPVVAADRPHRDRRQGHPGRRLPVLRPRRPGREHHRLGGADHPPADRHRGLLPERALADPEPGQRDGVLQAKLLERRRLEERAEMDALRGDGGSSWGNQIRSYVLHPYQMVKDLRTEVETGNTAAVLDGDIDEFIEAEIRWKQSQEAPSRA